MPSERKLKMSTRCVYYLKNVSKKCCKGNFLVLRYVENSQAKDMCANICFRECSKRENNLPKKIHANVKTSLRKGRM